VAISYWHILQNIGRSSRQQYHTYFTTIDKRNSCVSFRHTWH
jgi:hypothetical protein